MFNKKYSKDFFRKIPKESLKVGTPRNLSGETCTEITEETHKEIPREKFLKEHLCNSYKKSTDVPQSVIPPMIFSWNSYKSLSWKSQSSSWCTSKCSPRSYPKITSRAFKRIPSKISSGASQRVPPGIPQIQSSKTNQKVLYAICKVNVKEFLFRDPSGFF